MRRRASGKVDANQGAIVEALRKAGWHVAITSSLKHGFPDLVVSKGRWMAYVEVKPNAKAKLTEDEEIFRKACQGPYLIAYDEKVIELLEIQRFSGFGGGGIDKLRKWP